MKKFSSVIFCAIAVTASAFIVMANPVISLTSLSPNVICSTGNDTLLYSVTASGIPANTNVVIYQGNDSTFNPYGGAADSIGFIPGNSIPQDTVNFGSCVKVLGILIDACGVSGTEPQNEYIILTSGSGIRVSNLAIDFSPQNNAGATNADLNTGANPCGYKTPDPALVAGLQAGSCNASNVIPASPGDSIPANAIIIVFTSDSVNTSYNVNGLCNTGHPVYILQSACLRTIGAFTNASNCGGTRYRTTTAIDKRQNCTDGLTYDLCNIFNKDGTYAIRQPGLDTASVTNNGIRRNTIDSCGGLDYSQLNFSADTTLKYAIPRNFCNTGFHYLKAVTHPNGTQPVSNYIRYKLVCNDVSAVSSTTNICSNDSAIINISSTDPNASFSWTVAAGPNIAGASAGTGTAIRQLLKNGSLTKDSVTYTVISTDAGCIKTQTIKVVVNSDVQKPDARINAITCSTDSIRLTVANIDPAATYALTGPNGFTSSSANTSIKFSSASQAGQYIVTATGTCGTQKDTVSFSLTPLSVSISGSTQVCTGSSTNLTAVGTFDSVRWNTNATASSINVTQGGTYTVTAYEGPCSNTASVNVTVRSCSSDTLYACEGDSVMLNGPAGYQQYLWTPQAGLNNSTVQNPMASPAGGTTSYQVTAFNVGADTLLDTIVVTVTPKPVPVITGVPNICNGNPTTLTVAGQFDSVRWNTNETTTAINVSSPGTYSVTAYKNGCSGDTSILVTDQRVSVTISGDTSICSGQSTSLTAVGTFDSVRWNTNATTASINVTQPGTYTITAYSGQCTALASATVTVTTLNVSIGGNTQFCNNSSTVLNVIGTFDSVRWSTNEITDSITVSVAQVYSVTVYKDSCSNSASVQVSILPPPSAFSLGNDTTFCGNFSKVLSTGVASTVWSTTETGAQITVTTAGTYIAMITNACGITSDTIELFKKELPVIDIGSDTAFCDGQVELKVPGSFPVILWSTGSPDSAIIVTAEGKYVVKVTDANGCSASDSVNITSNCANDVWMPNAFSPNGDGVNDVFLVRGNPKNATVEKFLIYNRIGNKVFETSNILPGDLTAGWDGKYKGELAQSGVYGYYVIAKFKDGEEKVIKGNVTLLR